MTKIFTLLFTLTSLMTVYSQPEDSIFVVISGDTVHIWNTGAYENCGCLFRMDVIVSNDTIFVTEVDTTSNWAFCTCYFDLCASVTGLLNGTYMVEVFRYMPLAGSDTTFVGSTSFTYGGAILSFTSQTFQSDCYNITEVTSEKDYPKIYTLSPNYPNPFNPSTIIRYSVPQSSNVLIKVFDILGNEIETIINEEKCTGTYEITWYTEQLPSGVYFYQIQAGDFIQTKKMVLLK